MFKMLREAAAGLSDAAQNAGPRVRVDFVQISREGWIDFSRALRSDPDWFRNASFPMKDPQDELMLEGITFKPGPFPAPGRWTKTPLVYIASPYSHKDPLVRDERFRKVCKYAGMCMRRGEIVFSPIAHTHPIAAFEELPKGWEFWRKQDLAVLAKCDVLRVLKLNGWDESVGVKGEVAFAQAHGIPVHYAADLDEIDF